MPELDLHSFITLLESLDELTRITVPVDSCLEIATITNRVCKQPDGGRALLFEQPTGSVFPAVAEIHFPPEWIYHQSAMISLEKPNSAMVRKSVDRRWTPPAAGCHANRCRLIRPWSCTCCSAGRSTGCPWNDNDDHDQ